MRHASIKSLLLMSAACVLPGFMAFAAADPSNRDPAAAKAQWDLDYERAEAKGGLEALRAEFPTILGSLSDLSPAARDAYMKANVCPRLHVLEEAVGEAPKDRPSNQADDFCK